MSLQSGWRRCRNCRAICYGQLPGRCLAGGDHDYQDSGWYELSNAPEADVTAQPGWRWCRHCQALFHPGLGAGQCPAGGGHDPTGSGDYHIAYAPYAAGGQEGWRYCAKCHELQHDGAGAGSCPAGGQHTREGSLSYSLRLGERPDRSRASDAQPGWRRCRRCHAAVYGGLTGVCPGGGPHDLDGSAWYGVPRAAPTGGHSQDGWRWCCHCQALFHPGLGAGVCPAGGGHDPTGSGAYHLSLSPYVAGGEDGWRYCGRCHALHLAGADAGSCPAGGDHEPIGAPSYSMLLACPEDAGRPPEQPGWRRCHKCEVSCYGGLRGACSAGGTHDFAGSPWYAMALAPPAAVSSQEGWRWCRNCQALHHPGEGPGRCPAGGAHDPTGSGAYVVALSPYSTGGEPQWRYCSNCHALHRRGADPAPCPAGGAHDDARSGAYSLRLGLPGASPTQAGWRRCRACHSFCYGELPGVCVAGGAHDFAGSPAFTMPLVASAEAPTQDGWRWCRNCQALFHPGLGPGVCPAGGAHDPTGSGAYHLAYAPYASGGADGWCYCPKCHALHSPDGAPGPCPAGGQHTDAGALHYSARTGDILDHRCALIVDHDAAHEPQSRFEVVLTVRGADGAPRPGAAIDVLARAPVNIVRAEGTRLVCRGLDPGAPLRFIASATGRVRFSILPPADALAVPNLLARADGMAAEQWIELSPDDDLHSELAGLTGERLTAAPGADAPALLPSSRLQDARALATGVARLMGRFAAPPPTPDDGDAPLAFDAFSDAWGTVSGGVSDGWNAASGAISGAAARVASVATDVGNAIASGAQGAVGSAAQVLDTVGAAAKILIDHAADATPRQIADFARVAIPAATQLAIDVGERVTVIALVVVDGVQGLVKTVVETVESAAQIVGAFFVRVGLTIKAVIDFLASLFDWDAILRLQSDIKAALDRRWDAFDGLLASARAGLPGLLERCGAVLAGHDAQAPDAAADAPPATRAVLEIGGQFGYLLGKLESAIFGGLGHIGIPGLAELADLLQTATHAVADELQALAQALAASPLGAALSDPTRLLSLGADAMLALVRPLAGAALSILAKIADAVLSIAPTIAGALRAILQQRLALPLLTDFIELVVFRGKQELSLESLLTLLTAAFMHVSRRLFDAAGDVSFAIVTTLQNESESAAYVTAFAFILATVQTTLAGVSVAVGGGGPGLDGSFLGFLGCLFSTPYTVGGGDLGAEQWGTWIFNLVAATMQTADNLRGVDDLLHTQMTVCSAACGLAMVELAIILDARAIHRREGDTHLLALDLASQTVAGINNMGTVLPDAPARYMALATNVAGLGLMSETYRYTTVNPDAKLRHEPAADGAA